MPKEKAKADAVVEDEASVVDETTEAEATEQEEGDAEGAEEGKTAEGAAGAEAEEGAAAEGEEGAAEEEAASEEPEPSAEALKAEARIKALEDEIKGLKDSAQPAKTEPPAAKASHIQAFVQRHAPELKRAFTAEGATAEQQFDAIYKLADQLVGSVMADHVEPTQDHLATRVIQLENELEIRDLRGDKATGGLFSTLEKTVRDELKKLPWKERVSEGAVKKIYHRLIGERGGMAPPKTNGHATPAAATEALRDVSAGSRTQPAKKVIGFKLNQEQEADFQAMVEDGATITRERYAARYKARADKAKAEKRPIPKTLRSFR